MSSWGFRPYVPVAKRRANALKEIEKLKKKGRPMSPVAIEGRKLAESFWGKSWCDNLERYSDYENRLPRGRSYLRNGSVIDLQIDRGKIEALVSGSEIYKVKVDITVAAQARWKAICADCAGSVASLVELLQGKLSSHVMERVCRAGDGLFPSPKEIKMSCSCPDWAGMCKHVAATLYGVGARLDRDPGVLFALRGVEHSELISVGADLSFTQAAANNQRVLADDDVAALFGLEMETAAPRPVADGPVKSKMAVGARARDDKRGAAQSSKMAASRAKPIQTPKPHPEARSTAPQKASLTTKPIRAAKPGRSALTPLAPTGVAKPVDKKLVASQPSSRSERGAQKQAKGRTRAAKWIGAKARKSELISGT